ncbi:MAG: hypothetical protein N3F05_02770 [Candidatus Diapherotrites archaeon]|nr:hypothetical protein [Candidatus Diapherotrites archaeon]
MAEKRGISCNKKKKKKIVGLVQHVKIIGKKKAVETLALLDTGAERSSVDLKIAAKAGLGPIVRVLRIKSKTEPRGYVRRPVAEGILEMCGKRKKTLFTIADRFGMKLPVLVGRDFLGSEFIIHMGEKRRKNIEGLKEGAGNKDKRSKN